MYFSIVHALTIADLEILELNLRRREWKYWWARGGKISWSQIGRIGEENGGFSSTIFVRWLPLKHKNIWRELWAGPPTGDELLYAANSDRDSMSLLT
jgi:hypothetical protein